MNSAKEFEEKRKRIVEFMKDTEAVKTKEVENAFLKIKREIFVPLDLQAVAYADEALPIGFGQTISQPSTIAVMLELLEAKKGMKVLEVGAGSGYVCALLSEIVEEKGEIFGIELVSELFERAKENLKLQGCKNIELVVGDGSIGWKEKSPFDRILVSAACPCIPDALFEQLKEKGIIVAPVGDRFTQTMQKIKKIKGKQEKEEYEKTCFVFVPLKGEQGF